MSVNKTKTFHSQTTEPHTLDLEEKIKHLLEEIRIVLPGTQALLGFQFASVFQQGFDKLAVLSKYIHLTSLLLVCLATIFLMTPAAYERLVEQNKNTDQFQTFASRMILLALLCLGLGIGGDVYVVSEKITHIPSLSVFSGLLIFGVSYGLWFGYTLGKKK